MGGIAVIVRIQVVKNEIFTWKTPVTLLYVYLLDYNAYFRTFFC